MRIEVRMPKLGWAMEEGTIMEWYKREGERVERGEPLFLVMTDKVNIDVESPATGILSGVTGRVDDLVQVDTVIAYIDSPDGPGQRTPPSVRHAEQRTTEFGRSEATPVALRMAAEHGLDISKLQSGEPGQRVRKRDVEAHLRRIKPGATPRGRTLASPAARLLARQSNVDLAVVAGSGEGGAILKHDVEKYLRAQMPSLKLAGQRISLSQMRKAIGRRMQQSAQTAPHFTLTVEVDMTEMERRRAFLKPFVKKRVGCKLTSTTLLVKTVAVVLRAHPFLNAIIDGDAIVSADEINIGVALAVDDGLLVPVIQQADMKSVAEIASALNGLRIKASKQSLVLNDLYGGTFTLTNLGMFSIDQFSAIINPPQTGILATGRIKKKPVWVAERVTGRLMMNMTLSADHRVVDGAVAGRFLTDIKEHLENPDLLLI